VGVLEAFKKPVAIRPLSKLDHTYVVGSDGTRWECNGADSGGKTIGNAFGDLSISHAIAGVDHKAGIVYGVTGVCHQMANRILSPSGITVKDAAGYFLSVASYQEFGIDELNWISLQENAGQPFSNSYNNGSSPLLDSLEAHRSEILSDNVDTFSAFDSFKNKVRPIRQSQKTLLKSISKQWKLLAVEHAIDYTKRNMGVMEYVTNVNDGATNFVKGVANTISASRASNLMGMPVEESSYFELVELDKMEQN